MEWIAHIFLIGLLVYTGICVLYFLFQEKFIFVPTWPHDTFSPKITTPAEEHLLATVHGGQIHYLHLKVAKPRGLVFYLHGNTGSLRRWQFMAEEISSFGFDVVVMDYRGYGLSKGTKRESWMHRDAEMVFDEVVTGYTDLPVMIYGRSLGAGFATRLASRRRITALVLETPFSNLLDIARHYLPFIPVSFLLRYHFRSDEYIRSVQSPILILHGTRDRIVPYSSALRLYRAARENQTIEMVTIVGGKHSDLNGYPLFHSRLAAFTDKWCGTAG